MIKSVVIVDFQSHKSTELVFSPGVNVVTGQSQSGKTALLRAFELVRKNRPLGTGFIRQGSKGSYVGVEVERERNILSVIRYKGEDDNYYEISAEGQDPVVLRAFGSDVPKEVRDALNISDVNIQDQLSPYFLVLDSPGQIAQYIRQVAKLGEVDQIVSLITSKVRRSSDALGVLSETIKRTGSEIEELKKIDLDKIEEDIELVCSLEKAKENLSGECVVLCNLVSVLDETNTELEGLVKIDFNRLEECISQIRSLLVVQENEKQEYDNLEYVVEELDRATKERISLPDNVNQKITECDALVREAEELNTQDRKSVV